MTSEERDLITGLFNRLQTADTNNQTPKDQEASQLINQLTGRQPSAPYLLVQTLLVQEHALNNATARIRQLEQQVQQASAVKPAASGAGGFLSGLFGHGSSQPAQSQSGVQQGQMPPPMPAQGGQAGYAQQQGNPPPPYPTTAGMAPSAGGGFLKGALGTAAGVAGGALLFQGIQNLLGHNAGPFGGAGGFGGGSGFLGGGGRPEIIENHEVVNNYYDSDRGQDNNPADNFQTGEGELVADNDNNDVGSGGNSFTDAGFDNSNPFDKPDNFGLGTDNSAMDNNYDADNTDAFGGGGGDLFSGGDDSGGSDDSYV